MRPAPFEYLRPATLAEALAAMAAGAVPLAGGQSLLPALRQRDATPTALVDLAAIAEQVRAHRSHSHHQLFLN